MINKFNNLEDKMKNDFLIKLKKLKINKTKNIYVTSNLSKLNRYRIPKESKLKIIFSSLKETIGKDYSIFSPGASLNLCNTDTIFDVNNTPTFEMGPLAEYIRKKKSTRSVHPYWSIVGVGKNAKLLKKVSKHAYGVGSPWTTMLDLDVTQLNLGIHPSKAVTLIHHIETIVGVPYRFTKEFEHKVKDGKRIYKSKFYLSARYLNANIKKKIKLNEHFFKKLNAIGKLNHQNHISGLDMWSFKMRDFYKVAVEMFKKDIYTYLEYKPNLTFLKKR